MPFGAAIAAVKHARVIAQQVDYSGKRVDLNTADDARFRVLLDFQLFGQVGPALAAIAAFKKAE